MSYIVPHFIYGEAVTETTTAALEIYNPAYGASIGRVHLASDATCESAILAAYNAYISWSEFSPIKRARILFKFRELLETYRQDLATIITREQGKTLDDAKGEVSRAIEAVEFYCGVAAQLQGTFSANVSTDIDCYSQRQALGVCVGISPFNFPVMVPIWMMIPAIVAGNTFILKPSEQDPSAAIRLMELLHAAGLPPGVVNCVHGNKKTVDYLLEHRGIVAVTAVASTSVAKSVYQTAINNGKRAHTFGGAKNHCVVMPDADLEQAVKAIVGAAYGSAGERCMAISVVVAVGENTAQALLQKIPLAVNAMHIGPGDEEGCDMGPLISALHRQRVLNAIAQGVDEGAQLLIDGRNFSHAQYPDGYFIGPSLFYGVTANMSIYQNEIFGPVLLVMCVDNFEQALNLVNKNQYGNGTAIFTRDGYLARRYVQQVQVGMVGVNVPIPVPVAHHPFGGWKSSSFGDTFMHGAESIHFYTKLKTVTSLWPESEAENNAFIMPSHS